jgi:hypothetical protein
LIGHADQIRCHRAWRVTSLTLTVAVPSVVSVELMGHADQRDAIDRRGMAAGVDAGDQVAGGLRRRAGSRSSPRLRPVRWSSCR